jgi:hypothetical protein
VKAKRFAVSCVSGQSQPCATREAAERLMAKIEALGACQERHRIVEVS